LIGIVQGVMGGITFVLCGVSSAALWGLIMVILSIFPGIGTFLVWVPAMIVKFVCGDVGQGIGILVGGILIGVVDNFLRPILVGKDTKMPEWLILAATLGGISLFGIIGFIFGPILAAVFITILDIYKRLYRSELDSQRGGLVTEVGENVKIPEERPDPYKGLKDAASRESARLKEQES